jgi:hypothetical protein
LGFGIQKDIWVGIDFPRCRPRKNTSIFRGSIDDRTLSGLKKIIEVAEATQSEEAFREFLREKIADAHYIWP